MSQPVTTILIADDDADDRLFMAEALRQNQFRSTIKFVEDGEELLNYLTYQNGFTTESAPRPSLILLDLNMPRKDGFEALFEIKTDPRLCQLPVVVLSTSSAKEDVKRAYGLGGNSYITKPQNFDRLTELMGSLKLYWLETVQLPA
ncbi:response regulator [Fibrella aquatilis]|uniref:Response regulator n=1 Tax=Fibrella aquatilis TaxID=2817059 RepID=A0A939G9C4_9BACT|nr:response regulator [Fibrella aquatilis]MBO0934639.1 response regulator [Fibrella aquatilis]